LVTLLSVALATGNAHAGLHLAAAHSGSCPEQHAHHYGKTELQHQQQHQHNKGLACCCDCLGCTSAVYLAPNPSITLAEFPARVRYDALTSRLSGRALLPEPDPPKPGTPS
jgi:hypothetical protein